MYGWLYRAGSDTLTKVLIEFNIKVLFFLIWDLFSKTGIKTTAL